MQLKYIMALLLPVLAAAKKSVNYIVTFQPDTPDSVIQRAMAAVKANVRKLLSHSRGHREGSKQVFREGKSLMSTKLSEGFLSMPHMKPLTRFQLWQVNGAPLSRKIVL